MSKQQCSYAIRSMKESDLEQVEQIENTLFSQPWRKEDFLLAVEAEDDLYLVVDNEGEIVAYCGLRKILDEGDIINVAVKKTYHNQGIASDMLKRLLHLGRQLGITAFTLEVREGNDSAIRVYEKLGFQAVGVRKNFYEKPVENAVIMWLYL